MPLITSKTVAQKRAEIRTALPGYKVSVTKRHDTGIAVAILSGPVRVPCQYQQVNEYSLESDFDGELLDVLKAVTEIAARGTCVENRDSDYGAIPNFYTWISIGKWDRPYTVTT